MIKSTYKIFLVFLLILLLISSKIFAQRKDSSAVRNIKPLVSSGNVQPNIVSGSNLSGQNFITTGGWLQSGDYGGFRLLGEQGNTPSRPSIGFYSTDGVNDGAGGMGIYRPEANGMAFSTVSTERMRIKPNGFIGIGTSDPYSLLSLGTSIVNSKLAIYDGGPGNKYGFGIGPSQLRFHISSSGAKFSFFDGEAGNEIMTLLGSGNLGIGTTSPQYKLQVIGQIDAKGISINGVPIGNTGGTGNSQWGNAGSDIFYTAGKVGIGTNAPSTALEIIGAPWFRLKSSGASAEVLKLGEFFDVPTLPAVSFFTRDAGGSSYLDYKLNRWAGAFTWKRNTASGEKPIAAVNGNTVANEFDLYDINSSIIATHFTSTGVNYLNGQSASLAIGTNNPGNLKLAVEGIIGARGVKILTPGTAWPDYVFEKKYKLKSLEEVEKYIQTNNHLPEVPSAEEIKKDGIDVANMDAALLKKIEELTLYMIEMKKENLELKKKVEALSSKIK